MDMVKLNPKRKQENLRVDRGHLPWIQFLKTIICKTTDVNIIKTYFKSINHTFEDRLFLNLL